MMGGFRQNMNVKELDIKNYIFYDIRHV